MLSDYAKQGLLNQGSDACMRHLLQHSAAIVNGVRVVGVNRLTGQRGDSEEAGSGCPMRWGRPPFVLSAAHVFENTKATDIRVTTYAELMASYKSRETLTERDVADTWPWPSTSALHRRGWGA